MSSSITVNSFAPRSFVEEVDMPQDPASLMSVGGCNDIAAVSTATPTSENVILTGDKEDSGKID
jgi:hypothetical protein